MANRIEKLQRDFLWGDNKTHLVGWDKVCTPMANGSLGIRKLIAFNKALLGKWLGQFGNEETRLWRVVSLKFGEEWGNGLISWVGVLMGVDYGEVSVWVGRISAKILSLLLGWGVE